MLRTILVVGCYIIGAPIVALLGFPWFWLTRDVMPLYWMATRLAYWPLRIFSGLNLHIIGMEHIDPKKTYVYMSNHVSNLDPPLQVPILPQRASVLVKKELFAIPLFGRALTYGRMVAVDRKNREAAVASVRKGAEVVRDGISMFIYPEGTRSRDGRMLPFKKGPFYLAMDSGAPIIPVSIFGTETIMAKGSYKLHPSEATIIFHPPIDTRKYAEREDLIREVFETIRKPLPEHMQPLPETQASRD